MSYHLKNQKKTIHKIQAENQKTTKPVLSQSKRKPKMETLETSNGNGRTLHSILQTLILPHEENIPSLLLTGNT